MRIFAQSSKQPLRKSAQAAEAEAPSGKRLFWSAGCVALALALLWVLGAWWANGLARAQALDAATRGASTNASLLQSEMQKFRLIPALVTEHPDVMNAIIQPDPGKIMRLDHTLQTIAEKTHAAEIYVMDLHGQTFAASNWKSSETFVGHNYGFRPYFREALLLGSSSYFALGTVSHRPGLYLARRIDKDGKPIGVLALKVEFFEVERNWALLPGHTLAVDQQGMALIASDQGWRLHSLKPLSADVRRQFATAARFPGVDIKPLPLKKRDDGDFDMALGDRSVRAVAAQLPLHDEGMTLHYFLPLEPFAIEQRNRLTIATIVVGLCGILFFGLLWRAQMRSAMRQAYLVELEREVQLRTSELEASNASIRAESEAREEAVRAFREAREALARANRLTILGAVAAEVAHEINQPVAAIRGYAENSIALQDKGRDLDVRSNISRIIDLTVRIGRISDQLRSFSVKRESEIARYSLLELLNGALLIFGESLRHSQTVLNYDPKVLASHHIRVVPVQMEQVMINLLQNSLEALGETSQGIISIDAQRIANQIILVVSDNGPGIESHVLPSIFAPFITTKPKGMGLGLGISRDIIASFGGTISHRETPGGGATFVITLEAA